METDLTAYQWFERCRDHLRRTIWVVSPTAICDVFLFDEATQTCHILVVGITDAERTAAVTSLPSHPTYTVSVARSPQQIPRELLASQDIHCLHTLRAQFRANALSEAYIDKLIDVARDRMRDRFQETLTKLRTLRGVHSTTVEAAKTARTYCEHWQQAAGFLAQGEFCRGAWFANRALHLGANGAAEYDASVEWSLPVLAAIKYWLGTGRDDARTRFWQKPDPRCLEEDWEEIE